MAAGLETSGGPLLRAQAWGRGRKTGPAQPLHPRWPETWWLQGAACGDSAHAWMAWSQMEPDWRPHTARRLGADVALQQPPAPLGGASGAQRSRAPGAGPAPLLCLPQPPRLAQALVLRCPGASFTKEAAADGSSRFQAQGPAVLSTPKQEGLLPQRPEGWRPGDQGDPSRRGSRRGSGKERGASWAGGEALGCFRKL